MPQRKKPERNNWRQFASQFVTALLVFLLIVFAYSAYQDYLKDEQREEISITRLAEDIKDGKVEELVVEESDITATYENEEVKTSRKGRQADITEVLTNLGVSSESIRSVNIVEKSPSGFSVWALPALSILAPILFILALFWFLSRQMRGSSMQAFSFGQSKARVIDPSDKRQRVTFADVAGAKEAKEELYEIVDFLRNPKKFLDIGARIPKGAMLIGAPGTGKTLLARAVAGEAGVPFFYLSGSEFVEMFVGVGASRVRDLFKMAKRSAPAIIFIDEIDAVGRHRGTGIGGGHDEREQTLNQILVELDGFEPNEKVIVISATNRPDVLDPALLRPGRFDRRIMIDLPDVREREEILAIHSKKKQLGEDVDLRVIAQRTPGFSGADLGNLVNEAAILAARENRKKLTQYDLIRSVEKVMLGPERRSRIITEREKEITAYHEGGHALVSSVLEHADPVHKVTVVSRGHAGGYTLTLPIEERRLRTKKEFLDNIAKALGGYVAEEMIFGDLTTGASSDIAMATALARDMVTRYGMSEKIGPMSFGDEDSVSHKGGSIVVGDKHYSEQMVASIDAEVGRIMKEAYERTKETLTAHKKALKHIADELMKRETLERDDFEQILLLEGIEPKPRQEEKAGSVQTAPSENESEKR